MATAQRVGGRRSTPRPTLAVSIALISTLLACAVAAASAEGTLAAPSLTADLAARLGGLPPGWQRRAIAWSDERVVLRRSLIGAGFHRELELELSVALDGDDGDGALENCQLIVAQHLPSDFYADPYQLQDLERSGGGAAFELLGPLDLEL